MKCAKAGEDCAVLPETEKITGIIQIEALKA
jgi:hypothetical protein